MNLQDLKLIKNNKVQNKSINTGKYKNKINNITDKYKEKSKIENIV